MFNENDFGTINDSGLLPCTQDQVRQQQIESKEILNITMQVLFSGNLSYFQRPLSIYTVQKT